MNWLQRLNGGPSRIALGEGVAEVLDWAYAAHLPDNVPHRHTHFEICQLGAYGRGQFWVEGHPYDIGPGDLFIARPGVVHQIVNNDRPDMELFWFAFLWTPGEASPKGELDTLLFLFAESPVLVAPDEGGRISMLWSALRAVAQGGPRPGYDRQLENLMTTLLLAIAQLGAGSQDCKAELPPESDAGAVKVRLALRYVHDNLDRRVSVSEIAAQVHLSRRQLARLFAQHIGTSPGAYIEQARLNRAKALLEHTGTAIKRIATTVGYGSVHHFSRAFSRQVGRSPGAYREACTRDVPKGQRRGRSSQRRKDASLLE